MTSKHNEQHAEFEQKMARLREEAASIRKQIEQKREAVLDTTLVDCVNNDQTVRTVGNFYFKQRRKLFNHTSRVAHDGKIYDAHWCPKLESRYLVSAGQEGNLIVWDAWSGDKVEAIRLKSQWVTACGYAPSGSFVASGGLDNIVRCYRVDYGDNDAGNGATTLKPKEPTAELTGHTAMISQIRFISDTKVLSSALDGSLGVWDLTRKVMESKLKGHTTEGDTAGVTAFDFLDESTVASCGNDKTCRIWDLRTTECVTTMRGHEGDINALRRHPCGTAFGTASSDGTARLWDARADRVIEQYSRRGILDTTTGSNFDEECHTLTFSNSGRLMFVGANAKVAVPPEGVAVEANTLAPATNIQIWDVLNGDHFIDNKLQRKGSIDNKRITALETSPDGFALMTAGWDKQISIWFPPQGDTAELE